MTIVYCWDFTKKCPDGFSKNQDATVTCSGSGLKVVSQQTKSTPGVKKYIKLCSGKKYSIEVTGYKKCGKPFVWVYDRKSKKRLIPDYTCLPSKTDSNPCPSVCATFCATSDSIAIGVLFTSPNKGDTAVIKSIKIIEGEVCSCNDNYGTNYGTPYDVCSCDDTYAEQYNGCSCNNHYVCSCDNKY